jgi:VWFA-related protein
LGLTASDFRLYDNDVLQRVDAVSMEAVPLDVSIVVDLSVSAVLDVDTPRDTVRRMVAFLKPTDRFRVITMANSVVQAVPWQDAGPPDTSKIELVPGRITLVADSILMALLHRPNPDRRHLVVALTDGEDQCSIASGELVRRSAERSGAVFHWINLDSSRMTKELRTFHEVGKRYFAQARGAGATCKNAVRQVALGNFLSDAARLTGGAVHTAFSEGDVSHVVTVFDAVMDDFRQSYVLHYAPEKVPRAGFHRLRVELAKRGGKVRARPGYWGPEQAAGVQ